MFYTLSSVLPNQAKFPDRIVQEKPHLVTSFAKSGIARYTLLNTPLYLQLPHGKLGSLVYHLSFFPRDSLHSPAFYDCPGLRITPIHSTPPVVYILHTNDLALYGW